MRNTGVWVAMLAVLVLCAMNGGARADCFEDQIDIDFTFQSLDQVIMSLMPSWTDNNIWEDVLYQTGPLFGGADNDANGINDDDHFDLLGAVYNGDASVVALLNPYVVSQIREAFDANIATAQTIEISLNNVHAEALNGLISIDRNITTGQYLDIAMGYGVDIPSLWQGDDALLNEVPVIKTALLNLIGCYMTTGDQTSLEHLQSLLKVIINTVLEEMLPILLNDLSGDIYIKEFSINETTGDIYVEVCGVEVIDCLKVWVYGNEIQNTVNNFAGAFDCQAFAMANPNGGCLPELLGAQGDLNGDGTFNVDSYNASATRQEFMENESIINPPLQIVVQPESQVVDSGVPTVFSIAYAEGFPGGPVQYKWERIDEDDFEAKELLSNEADLLFPYPLPSGHNPLPLTVTICDALWTRRSAPATLTVQYAPLAAVTHPEGGSAAVGEPFTMSFTVKGGLVMPTFQWQKDEVDIPGEVTDTLHLDAVDLSDGGSYRCIAFSQNDDGSKAAVPASITSNAAILTIIDRIRFSQHPEDGAAYIGSPFSFSVTVTGIPFGTLGYQWQWFDEGLGDWLDILGGESDTLTIAAAAAEDAGLYRCYIYDDVYDMFSNPAALVIGEHMYFVQIPVDGVAYENNTYEFSVEAAGGLGALHYVWKRDGTPVGADSPVLLLSPVQPSDAGDYTCEVSDDFETITTDPPAMLIVAGPFNFTVQPLGADLYTGASHTFTVAVEGGTPPFTYIWEKSGTPVPDAPDAPEYEIASVTPADSGVYRCKVFDAVGFITSAPAVLNVADPLGFAVQPESRASYYGDSYTFTVEVSGGLGTIQYDWFKRDGASDISLGSFGPSHVINPVSPADAGVYFCRVSDDYNTIDSDLASLTVVDALHFTEQPQSAYRFTGDSVTFSVATESGLGTVHYQWYHNGAPVGEDASTLELTDLLYSDRGTYWCVVTDDVRSSDSDVANLVVYHMPDSAGVSVTVTMNAQQVVPPTASSATGFGVGTLRPTAQPNEFRLNLTGTHMIVAPAGAGIYYAPVGENGPLAHDLGNGDSPLIITKFFTNEQAAEMIAGFYYLQIKSGAYPNGEIRGQINVQIPGEGEGEGEGEGAGEIDIHNDDQNGDGKISLSELLRVVQFYNSGGYHCAATPESTEDGFISGPGAAHDCRPHASDYNPQNWAISLSELLRLIQFYNSGGYYACPDAGTEDGFCAGALD